MLAAPRRSWRREREVTEQAMTYLDFVGAADHAKREVATLSFAEQKMVAIARLLATECDVLLLDEPTSGVDAAAVERVTELVVRLATSAKPFVSLSTVSMWSSSSLTTPTSLTKGE